MKAAIAITGANGYLGQHLTAYLQMNGHEVVGVVRSSHAALKVVECGGRPEIVKDLDPAGLARVFRGCGAIVHLAGISAERGQATYESINVHGMRHVIEAASRASARTIVYLSGLGVERYGALRRTTNGYFYSKKAAEDLLRASDRSFVVLRPSYIVGPGDELMPALMREMESGAVEIVGDGSYRLQPVAVGDAVAAILAAIENNEKLTATIDLVGPEPITYRELITRVAQAARSLGRPAVYSLREIPIEEAERISREGGYRGLLPDELDVLLCDETADQRPLESFIGRSLTPLEDALKAAIAGSMARPSASFRRHA